ncbi:MAG: dihydrofolate reductase [Burkholderia sp.]|nr:dihydrofolate reductase [Burkholderia sp.]
MTMLTIIVARARNGIIGRGNQLPWKLPEDLNFFKRMTIGAPILMGRKTHESIGRLLPGRRNIVITRSSCLSSCEAVASLSDAVLLLKKDRVPEAFLIGGAQLYIEGLPIANKLIITEIDEDFDGDVSLQVPDLLQWREISREPHKAIWPNTFTYAFVVYVRRLLS